MLVCSTLPNEGWVQGRFWSTDLQHDLLLFYATLLPSASDISMATETITAPAILTDLRGLSGIPPFPEDIPTAPLVRLSLKKLINGDEHESQRLFHASQDLGFFYLDLQDHPTGEAVLRDVDELFCVGHQLFNLELEEKQTYDFSGEKSYFGYA